MANPVQSSAGANTEALPLRLHHNAYVCADQERTRQFYEDILGLPLTHFIRQDEYVGSSGERVDRFAHVFFELADGRSLAFFDLGDDVAAEPSPNTPRWCNHMALEVASLAHLEKARKGLEAAGVKVVGPIDHDGWVKSIYFFDPNGARMELTTVTGSAEQIAEYRATARAELDAWTREKRRNTVLSK